MASEKCGRALEDHEDGAAGCGLGELVMLDLTRSGLWGVPATGHGVFSTSLAAFGAAGGGGGGCGYLIDLT